MAMTKVGPKREGFVFFSNFVVGMHDASRGPATTDDIIAKILDHFPSVCPEDILIEPAASGSHELALFHCYLTKRHSELVEQFHAYIELRLVEITLIEALQRILDGDFR
jgi:hypothetical protein